MKLSTKSEYACLALIDLSENYSRGLVKIEDISKRKKIPQKYLEQLLVILKKEGYVKSKTGKDGGYELAKKPNKISIAEIVRLMDGALAPVSSVSKYFYEESAVDQSKKLMKLFKEIRDYVSNKMENTTFADLVD
jgi:Rrf2 family protein